MNAQDGCQGNDDAFWEIRRPNKSQPEVILTIGHWRAPLGKQFYIIANFRETSISCKCNGLHLRQWQMNVLCAVY